jgi:predicted anti-sigma-YlaC factor YlaD
MNRIADHPEDFGPYLDRDRSDPGYEKIQEHLQVCAECRKEVDALRSVDILFRNPEAEIEVPPFQWQRIATRMQTRPAAGFLARYRLLARPWKAALATFVLGAAIMTGLQIQRGYADQQLLRAISRYAAAEQQRLGANENPFRTSLGAYHTDETNPFAVRR